MKKYFERKAFGWYVLTTVLCVLAEMLWILLMSAVSSIAPDLIARKALTDAMAYVFIPVMTLIFLFAGKKLVQKIQKDGEYTGEYSRYRFIFYQLACAATELISAVDIIVRYYCGTVNEILNESSVEEGIPKALIVWVIQLGIIVIEFILASKVIGALLCAVTEGEESEKQFFSKIGLPVCISFAGVLIIKFISTALFNYSVITFAGNTICLLLLAVMLLGLKYKYNDANLRNIICNTLPFVYVGIQTVTAALKLFNAIY